MNSAQKPISAGLHFVSTPIGAARDITLHALDVLAGADSLAAEDTRTARKLMEIHGIALDGRKLSAYHDHSSPAERARLVSRLEAGESLAYISEAGTPLLADPGFALAREAIARDLPIRAAPGASALLSALVVAGLPTDRFAFCGFLPNTEAQRLKQLADLRALPFTLVFYESPRRVRELLTALVRTFGEHRPAALCRELTKRFEEVRRAPLGELLGEFSDRSVKGEIVLVVGGAGQEAVDDDKIEAALREALATMRVKDAADAVAGALGLPRRQVYQAALEMEKKR